MQEFEFWPDYGPGPVWASGVAVSLDGLELPDDLAEQLRSWNARYEARKLPIDGPCDGDWLGEGRVYSRSSVLPWAAPRRSSSPSCGGIVQHKVYLDELVRRLESAELLFQVLTEREEKNSIAIASNQSFSGWTDIFTDPRLCAAIVDRLTYHGTLRFGSQPSVRLERRPNRPSHDGWTTKRAQFRAPGHGVPVRAIWSAP